MGGNVTFVSRIGNDLFGKDSGKNLRVQQS
jgi:hypothetical protein